MKFYVAAQHDNDPIASRTIGHLTAAGWLCLNDQQDSFGLSRDAKRQMAVDNVQRILESDVLIVHLPCGPEHYAAIGAALNKPMKVLVWAESAALVSVDKSVPNFYHHPNLSLNVGKYNEFIREVLQCSL